jgi:hypothetical protein
MQLYSLPMRRIVFLGLLLLPISGGCSSQIVPNPRTAEENLLFGPVSMKLDTFCKIKDWTGDGVPDGVEALVQFDDRFGDRTKAAGTILFELFDYREGWPDARGYRLANPWTASLSTYDEQKAHWETASGAYTFRLAFDHAAWNHNYVLTATFQSAAGARFMDSIVLKAQQPENRESITDKPGAVADPGNP